MAGAGDRQGGPEVRTDFWSGSPRVYPQRAPRILSHRDGTKPFQLKLQEHRRMPESTGFVQEMARSGLNGPGQWQEGPGAAAGQLWAVIQGPGSEQNKELVVDLDTLGNFQRFQSRRAPGHAGRSGPGGPGGGRGWAAVRVLGRSSTSLKEDCAWG